MLLNKIHSILVFNAGFFIFLIVSKMVYTYKTIFISNPKKPWLSPIMIKCHLDTRALMLSITQKIAAHLQFAEIEKRAVVLQDGNYAQVPYVGPIKIDFDNRSHICCAFVIGSHPHLGAVHVNEMDFRIQPPDKRSRAVIKSQPTMV